MNFTYEMAQNSLGMFFFLTVELTILFLMISYLVGVLQEYIPPSRIQSILSGRDWRGYFIAALLGAITPFCSCSTIPFLKGLLRAKSGFGTMMVFLFASPLLNPIIVGLFAVTFGVSVTVFYFLVAMGVSVVAGYALEKLGFERFVKDSAYIATGVSGCGSSCGGEPVNKWKAIWLLTWKDFKKVLPYLLGGIAIGSIIYGFMPTEFVTKMANEDNIFAVPIAAIIGIPLYIRAEAVIPLSAALAAKGMGLGAVMALIIGSAGASLTEIILLKSIFKNQMIAAFLVVIIGMAIGAGYLYEYIF
ncbi:MAG: permease [Alphaproteobacteria bacterium]